MKLFFPDSTFELAGMPRPGIQFLCDKEMEFISAPNKYLQYVAIVKGRTGSPRTWETYGKHLYEYFSFLELAR